MEQSVFSRSNKITLDDYIIIDIDSSNSIQFNRNFMNIKPSRKLFNKCFGLQDLDRSVAFTVSCFFYSVVCKKTKAKREREKKSEVTTEVSVIGCVKMTRGSNYTKLTFSSSLLLVNNLCFNLRL